MLKITLYRTTVVCMYTHKFACTTAGESGERGRDPDVATPSRGVATPSLNALTPSDRPPHTRLPWRIWRAPRMANALPNRLRCRTCIAHNCPCGGPRLTRGATASTLLHRLRRKSGTRLVLAPRKWRTTESSRRRRRNRPSPSSASAHGSSAQRIIRIRRVTRRNHLKGRKNTAGLKVTR